VKYRVEVPEPIAKQLRSLPKTIRRAIGFAIFNLIADPRPTGFKKLSGAKDRYRIRIGDWRVIYSIEDQILLVLVLRVADRKDVYRKK
jgi:mRNA interferase RelE/StbE